MKRLILLSFALLLGLMPVALQAQSDTTAANTDARPVYSQETPRQTVGRHLYYLNPAHYDPSAAADVIYAPELSEEEKLERARQLRDVFDGTGSYVDMEKIPDEAAYYDSTREEYQYVLFPEEFPEVYLARYDGQWYYSRSTVSRIPALYDKTFPLGADLLQNLVPVIGNRVVLGLPTWKWIGLIVLLGFSYLFYRLVLAGLGWLLRNVIARITPESYLDPKLISPVTKPLSLLLTFLLFRSYLMPMLLLPIEVSDPLRRVLAIGMSVAGVWVFYRLVDIIGSLLNSLASRTDTTMDDQLIPLLMRIAKLVVVIFGVLFVLDNLGVDVTALLAGVSIGGLAVALAAQDTVKNFIGSISIFVDRPFQVGDFIAAGDILGSVTEVGVRTTRIRALDGAQVTVPNGDLANRTITNHSVRTYRRYATSITVTYRTRPEQMEEFVNGVREIVAAHPKVREGTAQVQFHEMGNSSLDIFYAAIFEVTDYGEWLACRQEVFLNVMKLADRLGVDFAFPSTSVYIEQMPQAQLGEGEQ